MNTISDSNSRCSLIDSIGSNGRCAEPSRAGPGPRVWSKRGPPALKAPKNFLGHAIFLLDHALKFTGKTLLLGGHALLYTVGNTIFDEKALLISASGPAGLETFLEETENKEKIQGICLSGPLKAPGPLVTTLATPPFSTVLDVRAIHTTLRYNISLIFVTAFLQENWRRRIVLS